MKTFEEILKEIHEASLEVYGYVKANTRKDLYSKEIAAAAQMYVAQMMINEERKNKEEKDNTAISRLLSTRTATTLGSKLESLTTGKEYTYDIKEIPED